MIALPEKELLFIAYSSRRLVVVSKLGCMIAMVVLSMAWALARAQNNGSIQGRVEDPSGAVVPDASVVVSAQLGRVRRTVQSDGRGQFHVQGLPPGRYRVTVQAPGFQLASRPAEISAAGGVVGLQIQLAIEAQQQQVVVQGDTPQLELAPQSNASAVVVSGKDLNSLSNDPDELQNQLQALAGPAVGPDGGEIYIDGFLGGDLPPKSAIREVQVNSNPFAVRNDRLGYGRIDIFTQPGAASYHGSASTEYNDARMNALSTFLSNSTQPPPTYHTWLSDASLGGPAGKNASFFFAFQRRNIDRANLVNTDILDSNLNVVPYVASVDNPRILTDVNPRVDLQLGPKNTLVVDYEYFRIGENNDGVDTQSLPSTAYNTGRNHHSLRLLETQSLGVNALNQVNFQYLHFHNTQTPESLAPAVDVLGAFLSGGTTGGALDRHETHYELQDYATVTRGKHLWQFGGFVRAILRSEDASANFNGTFTFNSLADYQQTQRALHNGESMAQIQQAGYGPSQYNITGGNLGASVDRLDGALFVGDDWKISPRLTASLGLRFETENIISDHADWAPRAGFSWALGRGASPKTVLRAGWGYFYERFDDDQMIIANRLNGKNQITYIVTQPEFYPNAPPASAFSLGTDSQPTTYRLASNLSSPYDMDAGVSVERQLGHDATASVTYLYSRGQRQLLSNDANAPLPGSFQPGDPSSGTRPLGNAAGNLYEYESAGIFRQHQLIANVHVSTGDWLSMFGYYVLNNSHGNTSGVNNFASNPFNLMADYGRSAFDIRNRLALGATAALPLELRLSSMLIASSGQPFSILLPQDVFGTGIRNARPAPATASTPAKDVASTAYGSFNLATGATDVPIAPNTATGPADAMLNLRASRTFGFGAESGKAHGGQGTASGAPAPHHARGLGGRGLGSGGGFGLDGSTDRRYAFTVSVSALNLLNTVNLAPPVSTLGSPLFGQSISLATGPYAAQVGNPVANRLVNVGLALSF
jgi:hypothetical protein